MVWDAQYLRIGLFYAFKAGSGVQLVLDSIAMVDNHQKGLVIIYCDLHDVFFGPSNMTGFQNDDKHGCHFGSESRDQSHCQPLV